jgi:hypothetical protein
MQTTNIYGLDQVLSTFSTQNRIEITGSALNASHETAFLMKTGVGSPPPESLADMLAQDSEASTTTSVAVTSPSPSSDEMKLLSDVLLLNSYISVASMQYLYKLNPKGWDITKPEQAADFTKQSTNAKFRIITEGMGGFLSNVGSTSGQMSKQVTSGDIHLEFLTEVFAGFSFPEASLTELDSILTSVVKQIGDLKFSWSNQSDTLDHMIFTFFFEKVAGLDYKLPRIRLFYLHIDQKSWELAVGKSSAKHFDFHMNYPDEIFLMDPNQVEDKREKIQKLITTMTDKSLDDINKLVSPKVVKNPA